MRANYNKENLIEIVKNSYSISDVARGLGLKPMGSNFNTIRKYIDLYELDTNHFTGQSWNKGICYSEKTAKVPLNEILKDNTNFKADVLKKRLVAEGIKDYRCEKCGCNDTWQGEPITLELHHINGNHYDNRLENLQILCPNCHSQTNKYKNRGVKKNIPENFKKQYIKVCPTCGKEFKANKESNVFCSRECYNTYLSKHKNNNDNINKENLISAMELYNNMTHLGKHFNVSKTTIKRKLEEYDLLNEFKSKFDFRAKSVLQYDIHGNFIKEWSSVADAEETLKIYSIGKCANFKRKSAGGFVWRYKNNGEEN